jgi:hypothetical protein
VSKRGRHLEARQVTLRLDLRQDARKAARCR